MKEDKFKKTEGRIYRYFENIRTINLLKAENEELDKEYSSIETILKNNDFDFDISIGSPGFEERVQTSTTGESAVEKSILKQAEYLEKLQKNIRKAQVKNKVKILDLEKNNIKMRVVLAMLDEEQKTLVYKKYYQKLSIERIADELKVSRRKCFTMRKDIVEEIIKLL